MIGDTLLSQTYIEIIPQSEAGGIDTPFALSGQRFDLFPRIGLRIVLPEILEILIVIEGTTQSQIALSSYCRGIRPDT